VAGICISALDSELKTGRARSSLVTRWQRMRSGILFDKDGTLIDVNDLVPIYREC
jgi:hypothetical protein